MKKKIMASLLVGSAVVGASLAPLSAQATTTGNTPVDVEFEGGTIEGLETSFDLIYLPTAFTFPATKLVMIYQLSRSSELSAVLFISVIYEVQKKVGMLQVK